MKGVVLGIVVVLVLGGAVRPAEAQSRRAVGWWTVAAGGAMTALAFNYRRDRDGRDQYRTTFDHGFRYGTSDYCTTYYDDGHVHTEHTPISVRLARPGMLWTGIGAIGGGLVLALWPSAPVARDLEISAAPGRVTVGRTFGF